MSAAQCVITGCALVLDGRWVASDLFDAGSHWLVHGNQKGIEPAWFDGEPPYSNLITITGDYWCRRAIFVIRKDQAELNEPARQYIG